MVGNKQINNGDTSAIFNLSQAIFILLQTPRANVMSIQGNKSARMRILFDLGSVQLYYARSINFLCDGLSCIEVEAFFGYLLSCRVPSNQGSAN